MHILFFNIINFKFGIKKFIQRFSIIAKTLPTTKRLKHIDKYRFV